MSGQDQQNADELPKGRAKSLANLKGGSRKGKPNKTTALFKDAIVSVYEKLQEDAGGDHAHFVEWAKDQPTEFYKLAAKLIPVQLTGEDGAPLQIVINKP